MHIHLGYLSLKTKNNHFALTSCQVVFASVLLMLIVTSQTVAHQGLARTSSELKPTINHEKLISSVVEAGPFAINCRYLSGEGPGRIRDISVGDLIASQKVQWLEPTYGMSKDLASINAANQRFNTSLIPKTPISGATSATSKQSVLPQNPLAQAASGQRLFWCRGAKLELIDEHGRVLPQPEFLCHSLIGFDRLQHSSYFPQSSAFSERFVFNFTQGIANIMLPQGFGLPLNNHERLRFEFKALNRTSDRPRLIRCKWTLYFVADKDLTRPIQALNLFHSGVSVLVGSDTSANRIIPRGCGGGTTICGMHGMNIGKDAPNDVLHKRFNLPFDKNEKGQEITWHWVVPPGRHSYRTMHTRYHFGEEGPIRAAGAHVHPFCEKISMIEVLPGNPDKTVFSLHCRTDTTRGLKIAHIDYLTWPTTGISLNPNAQYGWVVTYNNTSRVNQDAMAGVTLYFSDLRFQKPSWAQVSYASR